MSTPEEPFWSTPAAALMRKLSAAPAGLTTAEAEARLARYGHNIAVRQARRSLLAKLARKLAEPLVAILLIAAAVSGVTGDWQSFVIIVVIVLASVVLDAMQERHAESTVDALQQSVAVTAAVRRDGRVAELPVREIVPGDIVQLRAGDLVPADGIVLESRNALINEALLTGEPYPAEKRPAADADHPGADTAHALFGGTALAGGEAVMLVVATGAATELGGIARAVQAKAAPTAFERGLHALGLLIVRLTAFLVLFVLLSRLAVGQLSLETFLFAVALAVGLTPELLPMIMTVTLARGATRMAGRRVVVKRLSAIHDLGAMDVLCTDKTGTLTEAKIALVDACGPLGEVDPQVAALAALHSRFIGGMRSNLDDAILARGAAPEQDACKKLDDLPFDFNRRCASVLLAQGERTRLVVKGAPEEVLARCTRWQPGAGAPQPLDAAAQARIAAWQAAKAGEGLRLLGVAWKEMPARELTPADEGELVFAGHLAFIDPPKASATEATARLTRAGVRVKILSGDAEPVVRHLVETLRLPATGVLTGAEIAQLPAEALMARVREVDIFARVTPDQKTRIVAALRRAGHTVGVLGDGINDAPALHAADVGISVDSGTDVARQAADIILLAPDLAVLADGVTEGRRTYANIMKYVRMGTSSNFGNMLSMALAAVVLPFLPLAPLQVLLNNLIYDLSEIGIPFDSADPEDLAAPHAWDMRSVLRYTLVMGPLSSLFDLFTFALLLKGFESGVAEFRTAWFLESITTQILVIFIIRTRGPAWLGRPNGILVASSLAALAAAFILALSPVNAAFGFVSLPPTLLLAIAAISAVYLGAAELLKRVAMPPSAPPRPPA